MTREWVEKYRRRRRLMADQVQAGQSPKSVAFAHRVSLVTVHKACREHAVSYAEPSNRPGMVGSHFTVLLLAIKGNGVGTICQKTQKSRSYVDRVIGEAKRIGLLDLLTTDLNQPNRSARR